MPKLIQEGVPCIHLVNIINLAAKHGLIEPLDTPNLDGLDYIQLSKVGEAGVFQGVEYQDVIVAGVLVAIVFALWGFIRTDIGFRLLRGGASRKASGPPEPMV